MTLRALILSIGLLLSSALAQSSSGFYLLDGLGYQFTNDPADGSPALRYSFGATVVFTQFGAGSIVYPAVSVALDALFITPPLESPSLYYGIGLVNRLWPAFGIGGLTFATQLGLRAIGGIAFTPSAPASWFLEGFAGPGVDWIISSSTSIAGNQNQLSYTTIWGLRVGMNFR